MSPDPDIPSNLMPWWAKVLVVVCMLPALDMPWLLAGNPATDTARTLLWLYPAFALLCGICAWLAWARSRQLSFILLALLLLSHGAMWLLCYPPQ